MSKYIDIDEMLNSGKEDELLNAIQKRKVELAAAAEKKAKADAERKIREAKIEKARESAVKAMKYYTEVVLDQKISDEDIKDIIDSFVALEKRIKRFEELDKVFKTSFFE